MSKSFAPSKPSVDIKPESAAPESSGKVSLLAKAGSAIFGGGTLLCAFFAVSAGWRVLVIMLVGMAIVGALIIAYRQLLKLWQKRKALPLFRGILSNSSGSLQAISEPARRAKLDDLRRSFEGGLSKFRASGKDIYTLPWYVMVGEPAAGKTEAIRRCNVGFPPGLQDYAQGSGGTINMNWWFTNHAIILDTAGRLMFEEVSPGMSSEWREFLKLLAGNRPNCPINGLLLVIPADSLIKDSADAIERKAGRIAQQLDMIQRTLEVRFPVFVVVTKCDLINGFREFFDGIENPQLQHQMLGWSNPAPLDATFNPDHVHQHLETVRRRLVRRRYTLMLDPVHTEDPNARRIDQVDALFTFPDSFVNIGPRLKRYMEMIFTVGEWSPKPLFLRGIYFTSSMREGSALDAELADILKVPVETLHEGRVWERERAYFLRDLFVKKVFKEKGLVTRASNSKQLQRRRQLMVIGSAAAAILIVGTLTWYGAIKYKNSLGGHVQFWSAVANGYTGWPLVLEGPKYPISARYGGTQKIDVPDTDSVGKLVVHLPDRVTAPIEVPWVFRPVAKLLDQAELDRLRKQAYGVVYEAAALQPALDATRYKLLNHAKPDNWNDGASAALIELVRLESESARESGVADKSANSPASEFNRINLDRLLDFTLTDEGSKTFHADRDKSPFEPADWLYMPDKGGRTWRAAAFTNASQRQTVQHGVETFDSYWKERVVNPHDKELDAIARLRESLNAFLAEEGQLKTAVAKPISTSDEFAAVRTEWNTHAKKLDDAARTISAAVADLEAAGSLKGDAKLSVTYREKLKQINADAKKAYAALNDAAAPVKAWLKIPSVPQHEPSQDEIAELALLDSLLESIKIGDDKTARRFDLDAKLTAEATAQLGSAEERSLIDPLSYPNPGETLENMEATVATSGAPVAKLLTGPTTDIALANWTSATALAARAKRAALISSLLPGDKPTADVIESVIIAAVKRGNPHKPLTCDVPVPMTKLVKGATFEPRYTPSAAHSLLGAWAAAKPWLSSSADGRIALNAADLSKRFAAATPAAVEYLQRYTAYWSQTATSQAVVSNDGPDTWNSFFTDGGTKTQTIDDGLAALFSRCGQAMGSIEPIAPAFDFAEGANAAKRVNDNVAAMKDAEYHRATTQIFDRWKQAVDLAAARKALLAETPDSYQDKYLLAGGSELAVARYWNSMSARRLQLLNAEWQKLAKDEFDKKIRPLVAFPLNRLNPSERPLSEDEFQRAAAAIKEFAGNAIGAANGRTIGESAQLGEIVGAADLDAIRKLYNPPEDPRWFEKTMRIVEVLGSKDARAKLSLVNQDRRKVLLNGNLPPDGAFSDAYFKEGTKNDAATRILNAPTADEAFGDLPVRTANNVSFQTSEFASTAPKEKMVLPAPWPAIGLLFRANAANQVANNPRRWEVELLLGNGRSLWLFVDFDKDLPSKSDWPMLKSSR